VSSVSGSARSGSLRRLVADGLVNARDLGGLPRRDGTTTPTGRVFRSENVDRLTAEGWRAVHDAGIRTIVDLRAPDERARDEHPRPSWVTTVAVDHDGRDDAPVFWDRYWENGLVATPLYYGAHLRELPERTGAALAAIADAGPGGVLFHCAAGRDRTGMVALALLTIADVEPEAIVADHLVSVTDLAALWATLGVPDQQVRIDALCAEHGTTSADAFRAALAAFDVDGFVASSGLDDDRLEALRTFRARVT